MPSRCCTFGRLALLLLLPILAGCGPGKGKVSGRVLYQGKPVTGGRLLFRPADPKYNAVPGLIDEEGNYEVTLPVGEVKVAVDNSELQPVPAGRPAALKLPPQVRKALEKAKTEAAAPPPADNPAAPAADKPPGKYVPIPDKYYTIESSGLSFTVAPGNQKHDIELK